MAVAAASAVLVGLGVSGLPWKVSRPPPKPVVIWGKGDTTTRDADSKVYTAPTGIPFDTASSILRPEAVPALRAIVGDLEKSQATGTIWVEGYTDDVGSDHYNLVLSGDRARTVAQWLVTAGIDKARIRVIAFGEDSPAQPNDSEAHRQANRRVLIAVERPTAATTATPSS